MTTCGFSNNILAATNVDFRGVQPVVAQVVSDGQLLIGSSISPYIAAASLGAGTNIAITPGHNSISVATTSTPSFDMATILNAPSATTDACNKLYVDSLSSGFVFHATAQCATIGANLTATYNNGTGGAGATLTNTGTLAAFALDGVSGTSTMRVLIKDQTTSFQNGIYTITTVGSGSVAWVLTRATDYNSPSDAAEGALCPVQQGTVNANTLWLQNTVVVTMGSDAISYQEFQSPPVVTTQYCVLVGDAYNKIASLAVGSAGNLLRSSGAGVNPAWTTFTIPATCAQGDVLYGSAANVLSALTKSTTATRYLANTGTSNAPAWAQVALATGVSGQLPVANGGTGTNTLTGVLTGNATSAITASAVTQYGVVVGGASNAVASTAAGAAGTVLQGAGSANPAFSTATYPATTAQGDLLYSSAANTITSLSKSTTTTNYLSNTGTSNNPAWAQVSLTSGVSGSLPVANGGRMTWSVTGSSGTLAVNTGVLCTSGAALSFALPATSAVGDMVALGCDGATSWAITQAAGQSICIGTSNTTTGTGGSITSTKAGDFICLVCETANTRWFALPLFGDLTVV